MDTNRMDVSKRKRQSHWGTYSHQVKTILIQHEAENERMVFDL